jgi:hypothetical protein
MDKIKRKLKSIIANAFMDVKYPGRQYVCSSDRSRDLDVATLLSHDHEWDNKWQNIPKELVYYDCDCLVFFTDTGYQFFLPAYLTAAIDVIVDDDDLVMWVMYNLCSHIDPDDEFFDLHQEQQRKITLEQKEAICCFLEFVLVYSDDDETIDLARKTLDGKHYGTAPKDWTIS